MSKKDAPHLPGFYFDKEKNRYFKLIPGQEHVNPLTGESLKRQSNSDYVTTAKSNKSRKNIDKGNKRNIYSLVTSRETKQTLPIVNTDQILTSIFDQTFQEENFSRTHAVYEYDEVDISRILPSSGYDKILLQSGSLNLTQVDDFDLADSALTMAVRYHFPADTGSSFTDFSFAYTQYTEEAVIAAIVPPNGGSSYIVWGPDFQHCIHRKYHKEYISCCKWHEDCMVYSVDSNFVVVYNCDEHFCNRSQAYAGAVLVKSNTTKSNLLTACECTTSVVYTGHRNGNIFGYDRRLLDGGASTSINPGASAKNVCDIQAIDNDYHLLTRHGSDLDCNYMWDLRFVQKPLLCYGPFQNIQNIGYRGIQKRFFVDYSSNVMSCYHVDGTLRLWDFRNGNLLSETKQLEGGIYSDNWVICKNQPGLIGLKGGRILWLPLKM